MADANKIHQRAVSVWYVAFIPAGIRWWWDYLSPKEFRHVLAFGYIGYCDSWAVVDPGVGHTGVFMIPDSEFPTYIGQLQCMGAKVLKSPVISDAKYSSRLGNWCTQTVSRLIGLRSSAWRPRALYRDLLSAGAEPAFEDSDVVRRGHPQGRPRSNAPA